MLHTLILAAAAPGPAQSPGILDKFGLGGFGIEPQAIAIQLISFLILFGVLYYFGIRPVLATMGERQKKIESGIAYAEQMKTELASSQQKQEAILREAQAKAQQVIADTQKSAREYANKQQQEAIAQAADNDAKARQPAALEHKKMLADARGEIARLVVATTERVLARQLTDADRAAYNETAANELSEIKN
jgi:F-type H+-transporting ATPase subunit b